MVLKHWAQKAQHWPSQASCCVQGLCAGAECAGMPAWSLSCAAWASPAALDGAMAIAGSTGAPASVTARTMETIRANRPGNMRLL